MTQDYPRYEQANGASGQVVGWRMHRFSALARSIDLPEREPFVPSPELLAELPSPGISVARGRLSISLGAGEAVSTWDAASRARSAYRGPGAHEVAWPASGQLELCPMRGDVWGVTRTAKRPSGLQAGTVSIVSLGTGEVEVRFAEAPEEAVVWRLLRFGNGFVAEVLRPSGGAERTRVFELDTRNISVVVAVTDGMSDHRLVEYQWIRDGVAQRRVPDPALNEKTRRRIIAAVGEKTGGGHGRRDEKPPWPGFTTRALEKIGSALRKTRILPETAVPADPARWLSIYRTLLVAAAGLPVPAGLAWAQVLEQVAGYADLEDWLRATYPQAGRVVGTEPDPQAQREILEHADSPDLDLAAMAARDWKVPIAEALRRAILIRRAMGVIDQIAMTPERREEWSAAFQGRGDLEGLIERSQAALNREAGEPIDPGGAAPLGRERHREWVRVRELLARWDADLIALARHCDPRIHGGDPLDLERSVRQLAGFGGLADLELAFLGTDAQVAAQTGGLLVRVLEAERDSALVRWRGVQLAVVKQVSAGIGAHAGRWPEVRRRLEAMGLRGRRWWRSDTALRPLLELLALSREAGAHVKPEVADWPLLFQQALQEGREMLGDLRALSWRVSMEPPVDPDVLLSTSPATPRTLEEEGPWWTALSRVLHVVERLRRSHQVMIRSVADTLANSKPLLSRWLAGGTERGALTPEDRLLAELALTDTFPVRRFSELLSLIREIEVQTDNQM